MRILNLCLILLFLSPDRGFAHIEKGVYFYRFPHSLFASGQSSYSTLVMNKLRVEKEHSYLVNLNKKHVWISSRKILKDTDLTFFDKDNNNMQLNDYGYAINLIHSTLRRGPKWTTDVIAQIPPHTKMKIKSVESGWALVTLPIDNETLSGFVDLNNVVMKADFASFVMNSKKQWKPVLYREFSTLVSEHNERINLCDVESMITLPNRGIISDRDDANNLELRSQVEIERTESGEWNVSLLKGHGEVYWKTEDSIINLNEINVIKTEALLKKEITSVAFHPSNPKIGVASSQGIYITQDGVNWVNVRNFGKQNFPVAINNDGHIIVGMFQSKDGGKTFEPYIKWENLVQLVEFRTQKNAHNLQIANVSYSNSKNLKITLDTGIRKIIVLGLPDQTNSWRLANE